jgi:hypothetical protein
MYLNNLWPFFDNFHIHGFCNRVMIYEMWINDDNVDDDDDDDDDDQFYPLFTLFSIHWRVLLITYFHSVMAYAIIFWGNSPHSIHIFRLQKMIIRIITNSRSKDSCRELFKKLKILLLKSQYIFSLLLFVVKNREQFKFNSEIHNINTRYNNNIHYPTCNLTVFQKGTYYFGMKVFNNLPSTIKNLANDTKQS